MPHVVKEPSELDSAVWLQRSFVAADCETTSEVRAHTDLLTQAEDDTKTDNFS